MAVRRLGGRRVRDPRRDSRADAAVVHHIAGKGAPGHAGVVQGAAKSEGGAHQGQFHHSCSFGQPRAAILGKS